jgi:hypothetical protein
VDKFCEVVVLKCILFALYVRFRDLVEIHDVQHDISELVIFLLFTKVESIVIVLVDFDVSNDDIQEDC